MNGLSILPLLCTTYATGRAVIIGGGLRLSAQGSNPPCSVLG
jgi:hypothetical protein